MTIPKVLKTCAIESEWGIKLLYEFNHDDEEISYTAAGTSTKDALIIQGPQEYAIEPSVAIRTIWTSGLQLRGALSSQFGEDHFSANLSGSLLYEF